MSAQAVIVGVPLVGRCTAVAMLFQPEGIDRQGGATTVGGTPQQALAAPVVHIPLLIGCTRIPLSELVEVVVGERAGRPAEGAAGHIAKAVVAAAVALPGLIGAGGTGVIRPGHLVWMAAVAVEMLVLGAAPGQGALPQLAQVRLDKAVTVAGPGEPTGQRATAAGAVARGGLGAAVACPHEPVLLIVAEVLRLAATRAALTWNCRLRGGEAGDIARVVVATALREDGARVPTAALPGSRRARDTQIGIIAELIIGHARAGGGQEIDGLQLSACIVDQRRQVGRGTGVVAQPGGCPGAG